MRTLHSHLDVNKDGIISYDDFVLLAERFSKIGNLSPEATIEFKKILTVSECVCVCVYAYFCIHICIYYMKLNINFYYVTLCIELMGRIMGRS